MKCSVGGVIVHDCQLFGIFRSSCIAFPVLTHGDWRAALCTAVVLSVQSDLRTDAELVLRLVADL